MLRSRVIFPEFASSLHITGGQGNLNYHFGVYHSDEQDINNQLPLAATPARPNAKIKYLSPGKYKLYCLGDVSRVDGYPESTISETEFEISEADRRNTISVDLSCP